MDADLRVRLNITICRLGVSTIEQGEGEEEAGVF